MECHGTVHRILRDQLGRYGMDVDQGPLAFRRVFEDRLDDFVGNVVRHITQTRNLDAFLELIAEKRLAIAPLVTHRYAINEAPKAYDELFEKGGPRPIGMIIEYPGDPTAQAPAPPAGPRSPQGR